MKKTTATSRTNGNDRRTIFARVPSKIFIKLQTMAAERSAKAKRHVTLQEMVVELIRDA